jgi:hypothetical protein
MPDWSGPPPGAAEPIIAHRLGCDRNPLDVHNRLHRERLIAYIWPDQQERLDRTAAAIDLARAASPQVESGDAADWVESTMGEAGEPGVVRVLFHSITYQYLSQVVKQRIASRMAAAGRQATRVAPLAWLAFEQREDKGPHLTLRIWPGGAERILATGDPHGRSVNWLG